MWILSSHILKNPRTQFTLPIPVAHTFISLDEVDKSKDQVLDFCPRKYVWGTPASFLSPGDSAAIASRNGEWPRGKRAALDTRI